MHDTLLKEHQQVMLELLQEFDRVCSKYSISYTLFAGTLLGSIRHGGFIPWDDDIDVAVLRKDYDKFLSVAPGELKGAYYLQQEFSAHWPMFFSKLRKNGTACIEKCIPRDKLQHQGIYIDIFPIDALSDNKIAARLQFFASKVVIAKCLYRRGYLTDSIPKKLFMQLCRAAPQKMLLRFARGDFCPQSRTVHSFFGASRSFLKSVYPRSWFRETELLPFESYAFQAIKDADELLTTLYGNYHIQSPPEERALKQHAVLVDTEHSYEMYLDWQARQKYDVYTRSIR